MCSTWASPHGTAACPGSFRTWHTARPLMLLLTNQLKRLPNYILGRLKTANGDLSACFVSPF